MQPKAADTEKLHVDVAELNVGFKIVGVTDTLLDFIVSVEKLNNPLVAKVVKVPEVHEESAQPIAPPELKSMSGLTVTSNGD